jgi:hypothetical protein
MVGTDEFDLLAAIDLFAERIVESEMTGDDSFGLIVPIQF